MRQAAKRDGNEQTIVDALEAVGCSVTRLSQKGVPDLLVGRVHPYTGMPTTYLMEVKEAKGDLTPDQVEFFTHWQGQTVIVRTVEEALEVVGL